MKFCMGCMEQYEDEYRICPRCGYIEGTKAENDIGIVPGSILADRYIVGKMLNWDDAHISYIGWDALAEKKVRLQELFVSGVCVRSEWNGRVEAINSDKAVIFGKYKNKLIELADKLTKVTGLEYIESIESYFEASNTVYIVSDYFETEELSKMMGSEKSISPKKLRKRFVPILSEIDKLHELGYFIGMIRERNIVVTRTGGFLLKEHIWACLESRTRSDTADGSLNEYTFPYEFVKDPESTLNSPSVDVYSIAAIMYRFATGADMSKADCLDRAASLKKKHKDNIKPIDKLTDSSDTADHVFSNAVMNAFNVYPDYRTPDMERFIEELTAEKPAERRRQYKKVTPLWAKILIPAAAVGAVTAGTLFVINMKMKTSAPELEVTVPGFQSKSIDEARKMAEKSNLKLIVNGKEYSKTDSENTVISQSVDPGELVFENSFIGVTLSAGEEKYPMPMLEGMEFKKAQQILDKMGLFYTTYEEQSVTVAKGCIISHSPEANESVTAGEKIQIVISSGSDREGTVVVDDVVGSTYDDLITQAEQGGPPVEVTSYVPSDLPAGTIISQSQPSGTEQDINEPLQVEVSMGRGSVSVPDVTFLEEDKAVAILNTIGIATEISNKDDNTVSEGLVSEQDKEAGEIIEIGSSVTLVVSNGPEKVKVPDTVGMKIQDAKELLVKSGLGYIISYKTDKESKENTITEQSEKPDTMLIPGEKIIITAATSKETIAVPDFRGKKIDEARKEIEKLGLKAVIFDIQDPVAGKDEVVSQSPPADKGVGLRKGDVISIVVCTKEGNKTKIDFGEIGELKIDAPSAVKVGEEFEVVITLDTGGRTVFLDSDFSANLEIIDTYTEDPDENTLVRKLKVKALESGAAKISVSGGSKSAECDLTVLE